MNDFIKNENLHTEIEVKHPVDIAFDIFKEHKNGYCVILFHNSIDGMKYLVKSIKWIPLIPYSNILNYMRNIINNNAYYIKVFRYKDKNNCNMNKDYIEDVTLKIKMATEHAITILDLMSLN